MTTMIEHSRKHGPFDPRWLTFRAVRGFEQLERARPAAIRRAAVQAWEGEGGALLPEERPINGTRASVAARTPWRSAARPRGRVLPSLRRDRDGHEPERFVPDKLSVCGRHGSQKGRRASQIQIFGVREGGL